MNCSIFMAIYFLSAIQSLSWMKSSTISMCPTKSTNRPSKTSCIIWKLIIQPIDPYTGWWWQTLQRRINLRDLISDTKGRVTLTLPFHFNGHLFIFSFSKKYDCFSSALKFWRPFILININMLSNKLIKIIPACQKFLSTTTSILPFNLS